MAVTVTPETFTMVEFDADAIGAVVDRLLDVVALPAGTDVLVRVDERVPLGRTSLTSIDPVVLDIEGGALENPKRPRHLSEVSAADVIGRLLFQASDRLDPDFGEVPPSDGLSLALACAWQVHAAGRLVAAGYPSQRQRWLYAFRNCHGFTDAADTEFGRLWNASAPLRWADIESASATALAARDSVTA